VLALRSNGTVQPESFWGAHLSGDGKTAVVTMHVRWSQRTVPTVSSSFVCQAKIQRAVSSFASRASASRMPGTVGRNAEKELIIPAIPEGAM